MDQYCFTDSIDDNLLEIKAIKALANESTQDLRRRIQCLFDEYKIVIGLSRNLSESEKSMRMIIAEKAALDRYLFCLGRDIELLARLEKPESIEKAKRIARRIVSERRNMEGNLTTPTQIRYTRTAPQTTDTQTHTQNSQDTRTQNFQQNHRETQRQNFRNGNNNGQKQRPVCSKCNRSGHQAQACWQGMRCGYCTKAHPTHMCLNLHGDYQDNKITYHEFIKYLEKKENEDRSQSE
ncbi:hypothetical protein QAD02_020502 [Eretmocerus hayati]|uniref:Uncharacterized protein n=1 Tax=Eretmocerus hayati TaxID=131215 RepID=A0ACC2PQ32_9HYME|nr:hypothetical protein QAD02_020502 [Eretmocerus hayati]